MAYEDVAEFAGLGPMPIKGEAVGVSYQDAIQGGSYRYIHFPYALGCRASFELHEDDQYGLINQVPKALARSGIFTREVQGALIFNNGFTTVLTIDGLSLFNSAHPLLGGPAATNVAPGIANIISSPGTYPNRPNPDVDLSVTGLQLAMNVFRRMIDAQGMPIIMRPRTLVIPPELIYVAIEILGSPNKPYTANNEINALLRDDLQVFVYSYLTSASAWYLLPDKDGHRLTYFNRHALDVDYADDFDTRAVKTMSYQRFSFGADNWYGTFGSNGP